MIGEGKDGFPRTITEHDNKPESGTIAEIQKEDADNSYLGGFSNFSWVSSYASVEDFGFEAPERIIVTPKYGDSDWPIKTLDSSEDICLSYLDLLPRKTISVGPDFQADVPEWCPHDAQDRYVYSDSAEMSPLYSQAYGPNLDDNLNIDNKFSGSCIIPMPEEEQHVCNGDGIEDFRNFCCCKDPGSLECVDLHIAEVREDLLREIGQERFVKLGFCNMGDIVAEKWSEEEQQLFQEVVFSNPSSAGKNFWNHLSAVFPSRTKQEIVSYYFNVFMLRRRAHQNRCDSMDIDSDDDEWQESDAEYEISGEDEVSDEDEVCQVHDEISDDRSRESVSDVVSYDESEAVGCAKGIVKVSETFPEKYINNYRASNVFQSYEKTLLDEMGYHDISNHSFISSNTRHEDSGPQASRLNLEYSQSFTAPSNEAVAEGGHEFGLGQCDAKVWDDYLTCPKNDFEFLPTSNMIEEVFGVGSWNNF